MKSAGFLIFRSSAVTFRSGSRRSAERVVVLPGDVVHWKRGDRTDARGQVCEKTFTKSGRVRVIELDDQGEVVRQTTVHPIKILGHVAERMDLVLARFCPGCAGNPKVCSCPAWAPLPVAREAAASARGRARRRPGRDGSGRRRPPPRLQGACLMDLGYDEFRFVCDCGQRYESTDALRACQMHHPLGAFQAGDRVRVVRDERRTWSGSVLSYRIEEDDHGRYADHRLTIDLEGVGARTFQRQVRHNRVVPECPTRAPWSPRYPKTWPHGHVRITEER